jgi:hypothetical protein
MTSAVEVMDNDEREAEAERRRVELVEDLRVLAAAVDTGLEVLAPLGGTDERCLQASLTAARALLARMLKEEG